MANEVEILVTSKDKTKAGFDSAYSSTDKGVSKIGDRIRSIGKVAAVGFAAAGVAAVAFGREAVSEASDLNETINKTKVIFGDNAKNILKWSQSSATAFGLSRNQALGYASDLGNMLDQLGFADRATQNISKSTVKFAADLGSFHNLETGDVLDRISAAMRGEFDSLQALIPNINAARVEQVALAQTGKKNADALTAQEKAAATLAIIHKDGAKAAGDFAKTSGSLANQQKIAAAQMDNLQAKVGKLLLPVMVKLMGFVTSTVLPGLMRFSAWFQREAIPAIREFAIATRERLQPLIDWIREHWPEIQQTISRTFARIVDDVRAYVDLVVRIWRKWGDDILRFAKIYFDSIKNQIRGALQIIRGIINVVTGLIKGDWSRVWQGIKQITSGVWILIKNAIATPVKLIREIIRSGWDAVKDITKRAWDAVWGKIKETGSKIRGGIDSMIDAVGRQWGRLKALAARPVNFVINKVWNDGLRAVIDKIPGVDAGGWRINPISFARGGHTGPGWKEKLAGFVHADEFVMSKWARGALERVAPGMLDRMNRTGRWPGYAGGGRVWPIDDPTPTTYPGHDGADLQAPIGTPVKAAATGPITYTGWDRGYGNAIFEFISGLGEVVYGHLSQVFVRAGQLVSAGQAIGRVGMTGNTSGPHLHFGVPGGTFEQIIAWLSGAKHVGATGLVGDTSSFMPDFIGGIKDVWDKIKSMAGKGGFWGLMSKGAGYMASRVKDWGVDKIKSLASKPVDWWKDWASGLVPQFHLDNGGTIPTGWSRVYNGTGGPETLVRADRQRIVLELRSGGTRLDDLLLEVLRKAIRVKGGDVQVVLGR